MVNKDKLTGDDRRQAILNWLQTTKQPLTGSDLAKKAGVSRQVIVQDMSILKARSEPIIATSQGYLLMHPTEEKPFSRIIACNHRPDQTEDELNTMVDQGVLVKNVIVEHPVYGELEALVMVKDRHDVKKFLEKITSTNAPYLSELTDGFHLHTIESDSEEKLEACYEALKDRGYIFET